uniref:Uncharacterized protein n=1 Tax=Sinocyclocheilus anshuiensis TaxID=1608454 RepID=A0A671NMK1_9TELE
MGSHSGYFRLQGPAEGSAASPQRLFKVILVGNSSVGKTFHSATLVSKQDLTHDFAMRDFQEIQFWSFKLVALLLSLLYLIG